MADGGRGRVHVNSRLFSAVASVVFGGQELQLPTLEKANDTVRLHAASWRLLDYFITTLIFQAIRFSPYFFFFLAHRI